jgi:hypothetical protein
MILYLKDSINSPQKPFGIINTSNKVAGYKTNIQILVAFLYTNKEQTEKEIRKQFHLQLSQKYLGIRLIKEVENFYN